MKNSMKRFASLVLALVMVFSLLPTGLVSAEAVEIPEELAQSAYEEADLIYDQLDEAEESPDRRNTTTEQKVEAAIEIVLTSDSYVEGSLEQNGNSFTWWTEGGVHCVYSPRMREIEEDRTPETACDEIVNEPVAFKGGSPVGNQVYLIGPYYGSDSSFTDQYKKEAKRVAEAIGDADGYTLYSGKSATVDKVAEAISNGAVVFFDSHGLTDYENPYNEYDCSTGATYSYLCLTSTTGLTSEDYDDGALYYSDGICINGATIANHMQKDSPSGFLWMAICLGMATDTICQPLREKGVEVVYGYSESVTFEGDYRFEETFWEAFLNGDTVASAISKMKAKWGNYDWSTQIANDYGSYDGYTTLLEAQKDFTAFPVVVSDEDAFPGKRTTSSYGASTLQTVKSTYTLFTACDHVWSEATCTAAATCSLCGRVNGKPAPHTDSDGDVLCDVCGKDLSVTPNTYVKVTETPDDWSGQYLIVWEGGNLAFNGALSALESVNNGFEVTIENDTIVLDDADADKYFTIAPYESWYTLRSASGFYIGNTSGSNKLQYSSNPDYVHDLSMDANGSVLIEADDYSILRFNKTSGQMRFRFYKAASYSSQEPIVLYKLAEGGTSGGCSHSYDAGVVTTNPTCTAEGVKTYTCTLCGKTETEAVSALGHNYVDGTCENCGQKEPGSAPGASATVSVVIGDYAAENGWVNSQQYATILMDDYITVTATGGSNTGKYYDNGYNWRIYQNESPSIVISGNDTDVVITSVKITYTINNNGILTLNGKSITSGTVVPVNSDSVTFSVGNSGSATNGQVRITAIEVVYSAATHTHTPAAAVIENMVNATCTAAGAYESVIYCSGCKEELSRETVTFGSALGHSDAANDADHDCDVCGEKNVTECADNNADGKCDACGADLGPAIDETLSFYNVGLVLGADIRGVFQIKYKPATSPYTSFKVMIERNGVESGLALTTTSSGTSTVYLGYALNLSAKEMADEVTATIIGITADGTEYISNAYTWSIKQGAMAMLDERADLGTEAANKQMVLIANMLHYGAKAQQNFEYNLENLATDGLKAEYAALILNTTPEMNGFETPDETGFSIKLVGTPLNLASKVEILPQFYLPKNPVYSDYKAVVVQTHVNADGTETTKTFEIAGEDCLTSGRYLAPYINDLAAAELRDTLTITLYQGDAAVSATYTFSAESACNGMLNSYPDLIPALMNYGDCAKAVFG